MTYKFDSSRNFSDARYICDDYTAIGDDAYTGLLHLPMPRNEAENKIYFNLFKEIISIFVADFRPWLGIINGQIGFNSIRSWYYLDESPVTWTNWGPNETSYDFGDEEVESTINVEEGNVIMGKDGYWYKKPPNYERPIFCTHFLPAAAENFCPWLRDFDYLKRKHLKWTKINYKFKN